MSSVEVELPIMGHSMLAHPHDYGHLATNFGHSYVPEGSTPLSPSSIYSQPASRATRPQGSLSFVSSSMRSSGSTDQLSAPPRRAVDKVSLTVSPFRSVRQMKEPFQLKLPHSPSFENGPNVPHSVSTRDHKAEKPQLRSLQSPIGLRPLRSCRSDQNLVAGALETFGLLPSPTLSESRLTSKPHSTRREILFAKDKPLPLPKCSCRITNETCDMCKPETDQSIRKDAVSALDIEPESLQPAASPKEVSTTTVMSSLPSQEMRNPTSTPQMQQLNEIKSPPTSSAKIHKRSRTTTVSSAASWVPENLTYCEDWLQRVPLETPERQDGRARETNRRKFQIVQQTDEYFPPCRENQHSRKPVDLSIDTAAANSSVILAFASKMKPKLVDISRPSSSGTTFSVPIHPPPSWRRPSTPEQRNINEISAFSPDTPQEIPDSGYVTQQSNRSSHESHEYRDDDLIDSAYEVDTVVSSSEACGNVPFVTNMFTDQKPKHRYYMSSYNRHKSGGSRKKDGPLTPPAISPKTVDQDTLAKYWDYEWTLDQVQDAVKEFPKYALRLTSPVIILIRQNHENMYTRPLKKIFPSASDSLIDYLCAALIARNYLVATAATHHRLNKALTPPSHTTPQFTSHCLEASNNLSKLDSVPEKARATLGLAWPANTANNNNKRNINNPQQSMAARSLEVQKGLDRIIDKLLFSICNRHDETLKASVTVLLQVLESKDS